MLCHCKFISELILCLILVTLLSSEPEVQYVALRNINLIVQKRLVCVVFTLLQFSHFRVSIFVWFLCLDLIF